MTPTLNVRRNTPIAVAATSGDIERVKSVLKATSRADRQSLTDKALLFAAEAGHEELVKYLLRKGASVRPYLDTAPTPLHLAVRHHHHSIAGLLLRRQQRWRIPSFPLPFSFLLTRRQRLRPRPRPTPAKWTTALHTAAEVNDPPIAALLLDAGAPIDQSLPVTCESCRWSERSTCEAHCRHTPIAVAAQHGSTEALRFLAERGADPRAHFRSGSRGSPLLHLAAAGGHNGTIEALLVGERRGWWKWRDAGVLATDDQGKMAVRVAVENGREATVRLFLEKTSQRVFLGSASSDRTVLYGESWNGWGSLIQAAVEAGAVGIVKLILGYPTREMYSFSIRQAIEAAVKRGDEASLRCLLTYYGIPSQGGGESAGDDADVPRCTEIHPDTSEAQMNALRNRIMQDACYAAGRADDRPTLATLLPPDDSTLREAGLLGALLGAIFSNKLALVKSLLGEGATATASATSNERAWHCYGDERHMRYQPLHAATYHDRPAICRLLLKHNPEVISSRGYQEETALHIAAERNQHGIAKILIEQGADVNAKDKDGKTPLHRVHWNVEMAKILLDGGADVEGGTTVADRTPCVIAGDREDRKIMELLIDHGAKHAEMARAAYDDHRWST
ncbi:ankyrin repeat-containing domain protein [Aspergillus germanicus]